METVVETELSVRSSVRTGDQLPALWKYIILHEPRACHSWGKTIGQNHSVSLPLYDEISICVITMNLGGSASFRLAEESKSCHRHPLANMEAQG